MRITDTFGPLLERAETFINEELDAPGNFKLWLLEAVHLDYDPVIKGQKAPRWFILFWLILRNGGIDVHSWGWLQPFQKPMVYVRGIEMFSALQLLQMLAFVNGYSLCAQGENMLNRMLPLYNELRNEIDQMENPSGIEPAAPEPKAEPDAAAFSTEAATPGEPKPAASSTVVTESGLELPAGWDDEDADEPVDYSLAHTTGDADADAALLDSPHNQQRPSREAPEKHQRSGPQDYRDEMDQADEEDERTQIERRHMERELKKRREIQKRRQEAEKAAKARSLARGEQERLAEEAALQAEQDAAREAFIAGGDDEKTEE